jgi:imidazolonepropionase
MHCDRIWHNARLLTLAPALPGLGVVEHGAIASSCGRIVYAGPEATVPDHLEANERIDCAGRWITPGLIDCHTHLVYAGDRAAEFERRLAGATYQEIASAGGGIASTVRATRAATHEELLQAALGRLDALSAEGVTTVEVKSGYGLTVAHELRLLEVARDLVRVRAIDIAPTLLGAHTVPPEAAGDVESYVDTVCNEMIPAAASAGLAEAVDAYCETMAFTPAQTARVFAAARANGLAVKLHADQLSDTGGALLAAGASALSADHLEYTSDGGVAALAKAGTVAVLLPGAFYFLRETRRPPVECLRRHGVPMAVASDSNPGTSPMCSLLLAMNMAAVLFGLTVDECLAGVTREAAKALGRLGDVGSLEQGKFCNLAIWNIERPAELVYRIGFNPLHQRVWRGK